MDNELNLRPLQWLNNVSKGDNYPEYIAFVKADGRSNKIIETPYTVNAMLQEKLKEIFNHNL